MFLETLFFLVLFASYYFMFMSFHPMTMGLCIILQAMSVSILLCFFLSLTWFSFILFIVFLGGILMLFSYIISMMKFEELTSSFIFSLMSFSFFILGFFLFFKNKPFNYNFSKEMNFENLFFCMYSNSYLFSVYIMLFLLFLMIVVVFVNETSKGHMRNI